MDWELADAALHELTLEENPKNPGSALRSVLRRPDRPPVESREDRNRRLAIHHAELIQQRKDLESLIFDSTETLLDFPTDHNAGAARPNPRDVAEMRKHLRNFQPSDFDSLVEERNIDKKCGYVLCPRPPHKEDPGGKYRIVRGRSDLRLVETKDLEKWCSGECGKRALYLRVQLSETPAWERTRASDVQLLGEDEPQRPIDQDAVGEMTSDLKQLALERGNPGADTMTHMDIKERNPKR